jgi:protein ImuB
MTTVTAPAGVRTPSVSKTPRVMVVWCPDWPIVSAVTRHGLSAADPIAVIEHGEVYACSAAARNEGVRRGMRRRDAAAHCPELTVLEHSQEVDVGVYE